MQMFTHLLFITTETFQRQLGRYEQFTLKKRSDASTKCISLASANQICCGDNFNCPNINKNCYHNNYSSRYNNWVTTAIPVYWGYTNKNVLLRQQNCFLRVPEALSILIQISHGHSRF